MFLGGVTQSVMRPSEKNDSKMTRVTCTNVYKISKMELAAMEDLAVDNNLKTVKTTAGQQKQMKYDSENPKSALIVEIKFIGPLRSHFRSQSCFRKTESCFSKSRSDSQESQDSQHCGAQIGPYRIHHLPYVHKKKLKTETPFMYK
jgi:hypothetical protein